MPELPEVETTVRELKKKILSKRIINAWTDTPKLIKKPSSFKIFLKEIKGKKINNIERKGKNILFFLEKNKILLIHQKLTGSLLLGKWEFRNKKWVSKIPGPLLTDKMNQFIHFVLFLSDGEMLALSDLRKFAKVELAKNKEIEKELEKIGPNPLKIDFETFKKRIRSSKGKIKKVLMDQTVISGIGNIYSDESLFLAKISPLRQVKDISDSELKKLYVSLQNILKEAIKLKGESISDWRNPNGEKGKVDKILKVYRREGKKCFRCGSLIERVKVNGRTAHFCPKCQK